MRFTKGEVLDIILKQATVAELMYKNTPLMQDHFMNHDYRNMWGIVDEYSYSIKSYK